MNNFIPTVMLVIMIFVVYRNNRDIKKLNDNAININEYIKKSEVNDEYIFKNNSNIMNYLKARDGMKQEIEVLKQKLRQNTEIDSEQNTKLEAAERVNKAQNKTINDIKDSYRSDINYLVNLSFKEVNKHLPNESKEENLQKYREMLYLYVLEAFKIYENLLPNISLDKFLTLYSNEVSYSLAESIYTFKIYNNADSFPSLLSKQDKIQKEFKDEKKLRFIIETYFPRMFTYIENNSETIFEKIENGEKIFNTSVNSDIRKFIIKDVGIEFTKIDRDLTYILFVAIPTFYANSLYLSLTGNSYINELESSIILAELRSCEDVENFYKSWKSYNVVKKENMNVINETEKSKLLKQLIESNKIFETIYINKIKSYNIFLGRLENCNSPKLPEEYKEFYDENILTKNNNKE